MPRGARKDASFPLPGTEGGRALGPSAPVAAAGLWTVEALLLQKVRWW